MKRTLILSLITVIGLSGLVSAQDLLVPTSQYPTIQAAIDAAAEGDTVLVADGTYTGDGNRDIDFLGKAVTVKSENGPESTIIDCQGSESDPHRAFYFQSGEGTDSVLDGFSITNGITQDEGGGIYCYNSSPKITNCIITGNAVSFNTRVSHGGGIYCGGFSNAIITNCTVTANTAGGGGGIAYSWGEGHPVITNCIITDNYAEFGGGVYFYNRHCDDCGLTISNSEITGNLAVASGGGIRSYKNLTVINCTIVGNTAEGEYAGGGGGGIAHKDGEAVISNSILWGNSAPQGQQMHLSYLREPYEATVSYSNVQGGESDIYTEGPITLIWDDGNLDAAPYFVDPCNNDYHLSPDSPCINTGDPNYAAGPDETDLDGNPRILGGIVDMGAYEGILSPSEIAVSMVKRAVGEKQQIIQDIAELVNDEQNIFDGLAEMLANGDYDGVKKSDIVIAKQKVHSAMQHEIQSIDDLDKSIVKLNDALTALGNDPLSGPESVLGSQLSGINTCYCLRLDIGQVIAVKEDLLEEIAAVIEKEQAAYAALEELLASGDYGDLKKGDIVKAKQKIHSAIQHEEQSIDALEKSIAKLEDALAAISYEPEPPVVTDPNMVAHWKFDESCGDIAYDSAGSNDGTLYGDPVWTTGQIDGALDFDGSGDYVGLGNPSSLNFGGEITIAAWIKPEVIKGVDINRNIVVHGHGGGPIKEVYFRIANDGQYEIGSYIQGSSETRRAEYIIPLEDKGSWVHLVGLYDGLHWRLYRNGIEVASQQASIGAIEVDASWAIGARGTGTERFFTGTIDDVRIYNRALTAGAVNQLYNAGL